MRDKQSTKMTNNFSPIFLVVALVLFALELITLIYEREGGVVPARKSDAVPPDSFCPNVCKSTLFHVYYGIFPFWYHHVQYVKVPADYLINNQYTFVAAENVLLVNA